MVGVHHHEGSVSTGRGIQLFEQSWAPELPKAVVVLVHGFGEHSGRHESAALHFVGSGSAVQSFDLRGHGRSGGKRCYIGTFDEYLEDTETLVLIAKRKWPGKPVFLLAHSLGGLIASLCVAEERVQLSGLILSAAAVKLGRDYSPLKIRASLVLGRVFPHLPMVRFRSISVSRDPAVVRAYQCDELVYHGRTPARTASEIVRATKRLAASVEQVSTPLLVLHGSQDQVADIGGSRELFERAQSVDKSLRIYDGLWHEIMHEPEGKDVLGDISDWIDKRTSQVGGGVDQPPN